MDEIVTNPAHGSEWRAVVRDAGVLVAIAAALAFGSNAVRADRLPLIAQKDFETLVPCPEPPGSAGSITADDARIHASTTLLIDARSRDEYADWHLDGAINIPFDWLAEQEQISKQAQQIARDVARSNRHAVVVYGDGADPDSGREWAAQLNGAGIRNVVFVSGGVSTLRGSTASAGSAIPAAASSHAEDKP